MLVTAGLNDPRVGYWEPAKWVAKLRDVTDRPTTDRCCSRPRWAPATAARRGRYDAWRDEAFVLAFMLDTLGVHDEADDPPA